ncbi:hypothetical protein QVD17_18304 [Tagetes erecta]|uniref:Uncharacterized protein n=1 Tax=Tagetes erecta TaxID=13708 RepID=A0AAD8KKX0_TARER|nr:hypothetical protein QVD17_18304 [Tagetes erecta]
MSSMLQTFNSSKSLPVSHSDSSAGIRRRISALSFQIHPPSIQSTTAWALQSSKSVSSMGVSASISVRNWWDRSWDWIMSRKPVFAQDLEMNQEETNALGCHNKGSWRHVLYKFRSEIRKLVGADHAALPQTIRSGSGYYKSGI